uniref:Uncharacterized protein n=1 Tax=Amphimedon queenslandica TaxID=400682 RepID=A0A1X7TQI2_AMPQE
MEMCFFKTCSLNNSAGSKSSSKLINAKFRKVLCQI